MRKPTKMQVIFAGNWPLYGWLVLITVGSAVWAVQSCEPSTAAFSNWRYAGFLVVVVLVSSFIGYLSAMVLACFLLAPVYRWRCRLNGGPFEPGDVVQIISGHHRGTVTTVYSLWQGDAVRVRLGQQEEETFKDVFMQTQLLREDDVG